MRLRQTEGPGAGGKLFIWIWPESVGDLLSEQDDVTHPVPWTLSAAGRAGLLPHGALAGARTGQMR